MLFLDTKPRFQAEYDLSGLSAKRHYRKWGMGTFWPGAYRLPLSGDPFQELQQVWRLGGHVAIAQAEDHREWGGLAEYARTFYARYGASIPRVLYVDEQADFFEVVRNVGGIFQQVARSGRERNFAYVAGSQRPRFIPKVLLTETSRLYAFKLDFTDDVKHVWEMGLPKHLSLPQRKDHTFLFFDKDEETEDNGKYFKLHLEK